MQTIIKKKNDTEPDIFTETEGGLFQKILDEASNLGVGIKVNLVLIVIGLLPPLTALLIPQSIGTEYFRNILALYIAAFVILYYPLAKAMEELMVLRQVRRINSYVDEVKAGRRTPSFQLPKEKGDEHDFLRLQRNIFWMVQGLKSREGRLQETLVKLEQARRQALESIEYAGLIQRAFLPSPNELADSLGDYFLLWIPRDGVGGDAYWVKKTGNVTMLAVFDCTGHGVPGAFLTLIVNSLFEQNFDEKCLEDPGLLLSKMNRAIKNALCQNQRRQLSDDGLEGSVCCLDRDRSVMRFAGARSYMLLVESGTIREMRGDRSGVGFTGIPQDKAYTSHSIELKGIDAVYLLTDGITDQIGGPKRLPFGKTRLRQLIGSNCSLPMHRQYEALEKAFAEYKDRFDQRDDITVLGLSTKEY